MMKELKNIFNSWADQSVNQFTDRQWLLSKWENIDGIDWTDEKITSMVNHIREGLQLSSEHVLLDLGCGGGWILKVMSSHVQSSIGLDISFNMLKHALRYFHDGIWINGASAQLPFKEETFDRLLCYFVLINIQNETYIRESFKEISRVLKKGGRALMGQLPDKDRSEDYDRAKSAYLEYCQQNFSLGENYRDKDHVPLKLFDKNKLLDDIRQLGISCQVRPSFNPFYRPGESLTVDWRFDIIIEK